MDDLRERVYMACFNTVNSVLARLCALVPTSGKYIWLESEIDFAENSRALYEYMIAHEEYADYHLIWCVEEPERYEPHRNVVFLKRNPNLMQFQFYLHRCKYFIFTHPYWLKKWRKNQIVINSWHGNPFKAPGARKLAHVFDCMLASSEDAAGYRRKEFDGDFEIVILGAPRNDWLYGSEQYLSEFADLTGIEKVIYCMPTFKQTANWTDSSEQNRYSINVVTTEQQLLELNDELARKHVLLVCIIHHLQKMELVSREKLSNILYLRDEDYGKKGLVMNQMLRSADALVTDYSGVFLDYILLDRPIGFFTNTRDQYTRGFAMENPDDYMPGPHINSYEDFLAFIDDVAAGRDSYQQFRKTVRDRVHKYQDNCNCRRFLDYFHI